MGAYYFYQHTWNNENWRKKELMVEEGLFVRRFRPAQSPFELNLDAFHVAPGFVFVDIAYPLYTSLAKVQLGEEYMKRGCTLLIVQLPIRSSLQYKNKYEAFLQQLKELPVDYMVAPVIPPQILQPAMVRYFGLMKCPFILFEADKARELKEVAWEWLAQAQGYSRIPIAPLFSPEAEDFQKMDMIWKKIVDHCGMITLNDPITDLPLSSRNLRISGIYPAKGALVPGGFGDFNLFLHDGSKVIDDPEEFSYHGSVPNATILRGRVVQASQKLTGKEMKGTHLKVSIPKHFL
ncbi:hypothetical protein [Thalassobacillus pellis]|uniref:hypothetical protein n=1 Tax=Thalassobacillus pellis TaxID=748008 RepID=UPI001960A2D6|nr:hypothetical protein [Thalassobacillus pellis]MBM7552472.1 hypothetical protein [Thalassobacillus pellis]